MVEAKRAEGRARHTRAARIMDMAIAVWFLLLFPGWVGG